MKILLCDYPGALAWGKNYPKPKGTKRNMGPKAKNGANPGYVRADRG